MAKADNPQQRASASDVLAQKALRFRALSTDTHLEVSGRISADVLDEGPAVGDHADDLPLEPFILQRGRHRHGGDNWAEFASDARTGHLSERERARRRGPAKEEMSGATNRGGKSEGWPHDQSLKGRPEVNCEPTGDTPGASSFAFRVVQGFLRAARLWRLSAPAQRLTVIARLSSAALP